jgi:beta-lactam-binding protein with PASTA domain
VTDQTPTAGTVVAPGSTVTITVNRGPLHPC